MTTIFSPKRVSRNKLEYLVTPYNRTLNVRKHMSFKEGSKEVSKWKVLSDFVLKENKDVLRRSLVQINNALYVEFENVAKWAMNRMNVKGVNKFNFSVQKSNNIVRTL
jgi:hypothetical protein